MNTNRPYRKQVHISTSNDMLEKTWSIAWLSIFPNRAERRAGITTMWVIN